MREVLWEKYYRRSGEVRRRQRNTYRYLEPTKFVILRIFGPNFVQIWQFWCFWKAEIEIYPNLAKLIEKRSKFCQNREFGFRVKDPKFGFELGLRISNFRFSPNSKNFTKNQNSATVVYHNFDDLSIEFEVQHFPKFGPNIGVHRRDKTFSKILKSIWTKSCKFHQNWLKSPKFSI